MAHHPPVAQAVLKRSRGENTSPAPSVVMPVSDGVPPNHTGSRTSLLALATALIVLGWLFAVFTIDPIRFVIFNPRGKTGFEVFLALGQLFGALVLWLSSSDPGRARMRWVASALLVLGTGALGFGYILPLFEASPDPNISMHGSLLVRSAATVLAAIGLAPRQVPTFTPRILVGIIFAGLTATLIVAFFGEGFPRLVHARDIDSLIATAAVQGFPGLTGWHLGLGLIPLTASFVATWGVLAHLQGQAFGRWLVVGIVLLAGAQLHSMFWPSMYSSILTPTSLLRFGFTMVIITGGIIELRQLSIERAALLAEEQERVRQLQELDQMKRDFSSMVAHELASPLAAIGAMAQMISLGVLPAAEQQKTADRIQGEARILQLLVQDIRASADIERDDFTVQPRPVSLRELFEDAEAYGRNVQGRHRLSVELDDDACVLADPERIGQVIRNLLNNAVRHTPEGTRIVLRATRQDRHVRIEVEDDGPGIDLADRVRIFEKFGRGGDAGADGRGLGLYLSRRILQAHGSDLTVDSEPGRGARFIFELRETP